MWSIAIIVEQHNSLYDYAGKSDSFGSSVQLGVTQQINVWSKTVMALSTIQYHCLIDAHSNYSDKVCLS